MSNDPFTARPPGDRYLACSAWNGSMAGILTWLRQGIHINDPAGGRTPLQWAISRGHKDIMALLLRHGADISLKTEAGDNALACAVWSGNVEMVQLMIEKGFDPLEKNRHGKSALDWAEQGGNAEVIKLIGKYMGDVSHVRAAARQQNLILLARQRKHSFRP